MKKHEDEIAEISTWACEAFPDGLPKEILIGEFDHTKPVHGDKDLLFIVQKLI